MTPAETTRETLAPRSFDAAADERRIFVTHRDRGRLETIIRDAVTSSRERRDYLVALHRELQRATVVESTAVPPDVVTMNSTVRVRDLDADEAETYTLVYPAFADAACGRLSVLAPIGTALIGCREGDVVEWPVPAGRARLRIEALDHQPERAGHYDV